jgi:hypothetical protein
MAAAVTRSRIDALEMQTQQRDHDVAELKQNPGRWRQAVAVPHPAAQRLAGAVTKL